MQTQGSFLDELKSMYKNSTYMKLIFLNVGIFLALNIVFAFARLSDVELEAIEWGYYLFAMNSDISEFIYQPWSIVTAMFAHTNFMHLLFNMLMLFFVGRMFEQLYGGKKLLYVYVLGGLAGGVLELISHLVFSSLFGESVMVLGASGAIMAIFVMLAFSQPNLKVNLFMVLPVRIIWLAVVYIVVDFLRLGTEDGVAHFAHLGGAIIGVLGAQNMYSSSNIIVATESATKGFSNLFKRNKRPKLKVKRGRDVRQMTDEEYNADAKSRQQDIDRILDKISKSGYESLSKKEKDFLFNQSNNGKNP